MQTNRVVFETIGVLRTPHSKSQGAPIQPSGARGARGRAELDPALQDGLGDLAGFSHLILLYHCHLAKPAKLKVTPFLDGEPHGVFATRAPARPNPIGLSVVRLERIKGPVLHLLDVDMLDNTPLLDIKPLVPEFDQPLGPVRLGWLEKSAQRSGAHKGDNRFARE